MKKLAVLITTFLVLLTGCIDSDENISINKDGSGVYAVKMDMSRMLDMIKGFQEMAAAETGKKDSTQQKMLPEKAMDTTIHFADLPDTSGNLSEAEKALMRDGTLHMVMNQDAGQFRMEMRFPFKKPEDLVRIQELMQRNGGMMGNAMKGFNEGTEQAGQLPDVNSLFDFTFRDGLIERRLNPERLKAFQENNQMSQLKEATTMFGESSFNTAIQLPRKPKKMEGPGVKPGADANTIIIKTTLEEVLQNPNALTFRVEY